ncbi:MAG: hypothetical protein SFW63_09450 [Alphaproteobacteria bacterium]|nr:hypothetical protein [Alphaproteobacteria bacterium]
MKHEQEPLRKITVNLPASLLTGFEPEEPNLTELLRKALTSYKRKQLFGRLEARRGKMDFGAGWKDLRHDRG